ncbi:septal ring lytic transglycosylase RlpA family protein [Sinorhizobium meliloti]|nr:septal ring lytic transglycosylase RlpA family protein [Sinorhizobium meliloti]
MASKYLRTLSAAALAASMAFSLPAGAANAKAQPANCGGASWYALTSRTASGERMNPSHLTAAHKSLEFGTKLKVTNQRNGKSVIVRINDRGPFKKGRVIDVSKAAAGQLGMIRSGVGRICYQVVG